MHDAHGPFAPLKVAGFESTLTGWVHPTADNKDEPLALAIDKAVRDSRQDDWRGNIFKTKKVRAAIKGVLRNRAARSRLDAGQPPPAGAQETPHDVVDVDAEAERILDLVKAQHGY